MLQLLCMCKVLLQTRSSINSWTQIQKCKAWHWKAIKLTLRNGNSELRTSDCLKSSLPFSFIAFAADCACALDWPRTYQVVLRSNPKLLTESFKNIHLRSPFVPFESLQLDIEDVRWCSIFFCFTLLVWPEDRFFSCVAVAGWPWPCGRGRVGWPGSLHVVCVAGLASSPWPCPGGRLWPDGLAVCMRSGGRVAVALALWLFVCGLAAGWPDGRAVAGWPGHAQIVPGQGWTKASHACPHL